MRQNPSGTKHMILQIQLGELSYKTTTKRLHHTCSCNHHKKEQKQWCLKIVLILAFTHYSLWSYGRQALCKMTWVQFQLYKKGYNVAQKNPNLPILKGSYTFFLPFLALGSAFASPMAWLGFFSLQIFPSCYAVVCFEREMGPFGCSTDWAITPPLPTCFVEIRGWLKFCWVWVVLK